MKQVFVGLGSNLGNSLEIITKALKEIAAHQDIEELKVSNFYQTEPISEISQNDFINAVCSFKTSMLPYQLLYFLKQIESFLGKVEKPKNAPRMIDLDIIFFGEEIHQFTDLEIPHPRWNSRLFVLIPLSELTHHCPTDSNIKISEIISSFSEKQRIALISQKGNSHDLFKQDIQFK